MVLALDAETGKTLWTFQAPGATRLALAAGLVVAVTTTTIHGLSADGAPLWSAPLVGAPSAEPVVAVGVPPCLDQHHRRPKKACRRGRLP